MSFHIFFIRNLTIDNIFLSVNRTLKMFSAIKDILKILVDEEGKEMNRIQIFLRDYSNFTFKKIAKITSNVF